MNAAWKQDPRLKTMNQEKLNYLTKLAETVEQTPKDKLMPLFMSMAAGSGQFQFTDSETDLLVSIMTAKMSPAEKKRVEMLKKTGREEKINAEKEEAFSCSTKGNGKRFLPLFSKKTAESRFYFRSPSSRVREGCSTRKLPLPRRPR